MKYNKQVGKVFLALVLLLWLSEGFAVGLGFTVGSGAEEWESDTDENYNLGNVRHNGDREISNFGFLVDTTVAKNKLFNYRFSMVSEKNNADSSEANIDLKGFAMVHDFGFGVFRNRYMRLWLGPQLKASFYQDVSSSHNTSAEYDGDVWGFGLGPVVGLNIHLPKVVSFSVTAGYHVFSHYVGSYDVTAFNFTESFDVDVKSTGTFLNASVIFRIVDNYY